jgi:hypothetical protein
MKKKIYYSQISQETKDRIIEKFRYARSMRADANQAVAIAASDGFELTDRQWNGKMGGDAYATAAAVLLFSGELGAAMAVDYLRTRSAGQKEKKVSLIFSK